MASDTFGMLTPARIDALLRGLGEAFAAATEHYDSDILAQGHNFIEHGHSKPGDSPDSTQADVLVWCISRSAGGFHVTMKEKVKR